METHLTDRINGLGGLEADLVRAQLAEMRDELVKLKYKAANVSPPLTTDTIVQ